jgi:uracil-DNA glycosylase
MDAPLIKSAFEGVDEEYKDVLVRGEILPVFLKCISNLNKVIGGDAKNISPEPQDIFNAFKQCPYHMLKIVILGQDPYANGSANGLAFSVKKQYDIPPSLKNIFKALINSKCLVNAPEHGDLTSWAQQGVLLLNVALSIESSNVSSSHMSIWQDYTNKILYDLCIRTARDKRPLIFLLWGSFAKAKKQIINQANHQIQKEKLDIVHTVFECIHPSPAAPGNNDPADPLAFVNNNHFIESNKLLDARGQDKIMWDEF